MRRISTAFAFLLLAACQTLAPTPPRTERVCYWETACFTTEISDRGKHVTLVLDYAGSYEPFTFDLTSTARLMSGRIEPHRRIVLQEPAHLELFDLTADRGAEGYSWSWHVDWHPGTKPAAHEDPAVYRLPFEDGARYEVIQGYGGTFSHTGANRFAIDFGMPVGTPVLAARGGVVVKTGAASNRKGRGQDNHVVIRHADGTYAYYLHLCQGCVTVREGQTVRAGDRIGASGDTGYSARPHLHFHVSTLNPEGAATLYRTFPTRFATDRGIVAGLEEGHRYGAVTP